MSAPEPEPITARSSASRMTHTRRLPRALAHTHDRYRASRADSARESVHQFAAPRTLPTGPNAHSHTRWPEWPASIHGNARKCTSGLRSRAGPLTRAVRPPLAGTCATATGWQWQGARLWFLQALQVGRRSCRQVGRRLRSWFASCRHLELAGHVSPTPCLPKSVRALHHGAADGTSA